MYLTLARVMRSYFRLKTLLFFRLNMRIYHGPCLNVLIDAILNIIFLRHTISV